MIGWYSVLSDSALTLTLSTPLKSIRFQNTDLDHNHDESYYELKIDFGNLQPYFLVSISDLYDLRCDAFFYHSAN